MAINLSHRCPSADFGLLVHKKVIQVEYTRASNVFFDVLLVLAKEDVPCFTVMVVFLC